MVTMDGSIKGIGGHDPTKLTIACNYIALSIVFVFFSSFEYNWGGGD